MGIDNGNGNGQRRDSSALDAIEARIAARLESETVTELVVEQGSETYDDEPAPDTADDPLTAWKRRRHGEPITLDQIHAGLIATCEYSEAAIENNVKLAADVHDSMGELEVRTQQIASLAARAESTNALAHQIDGELAKVHTTLTALHTDVAHLKSDVGEMKEMLVKLLGRLPG